MSRLSGKYHHQIPRIPAYVAALLVVWLTWSALPGALAQPATQDDPYPAPVVPELNAIQQDDAPVDVIDQPYPAPTAEANSVVGGSSQQPPGSGSPITAGESATTSQTTPTQSPSGLYFLWGGFLAALLIFATAVVGSVVLFARRAE